MKEIPLTRGFVALVDDEDYVSLSAHRWYVDGVRVSRSTFPRGAYGGEVKERMGRRIMNAHPGERVYFIDGDSLNCQRDNLYIKRPAKRVVKRWGKNGYKGVSFDKTQNGYVARIRYRLKNLFLGRFPDAITAARAYDEAARKYRGAGARLNFPVDGELSAAGD